MATKTLKAPAPYLSTCSDCGSVKNPEEYGPQLDKKQTTDTQAVYICRNIPDPKHAPDKVCGLSHAVGRKADGSTSSGGK